MNHKMFTLSMLSLSMLSLAGCKKDKAKDTPEAASAKPAAAADKAAPPAKGACPAGMTNANNLGVCIKLIDGLTQADENVGHGGGEKVAGWKGEGSTDVHIVVGDYTRMFWQGKIDELVAGGGFGGTLIDKATVGADGITATFKADSGTTERKIRVTRIHNDDFSVECWASKEVMSTVGPKVDDVLAICESITLL